MNSCFYEGSVWHRRREPFLHSFRYDVSFLYLDLDEIHQAFHNTWLWSATRPSFAWFRRQDYLGPADQPLQESVREVLANHGLGEVRGPTRLLTHPRYFGFVMNPVSFYFCYHEDGETLAAVIADVTNTPWGERHSYVIRAADLRSSRTFSRTLEKVFHVSPFLPMDMTYHWQLSAPGEQLKVHIESCQEYRSVFSATMSLTRRSWTSANLRRALWRFPLMTYQVAAAIYWQALQLWWKGARYHPHPTPPNRNSITQETTTS
jgi:uncharacterized protein